MRKRKHKDFAPYRRETFQDHAARMMRIYEYPFYDRHEDRQRLALREELAYAARRLEARQDWPRGTLDRLAGLVITLHDLGKLDKRWQAWAHQWQEDLSRLRDEDLTIPHDYMAAHTDYDAGNDAEETLNRKLRRMKPNHAVESAQAVEELLWARLGEEPLVRAALSAMARHHSAGASGSYGAFEAHRAARPALADVIHNLDRDHIAWAFPEGTIARKLVRPDREAELLAYLLLVRTLRLADQRSQSVQH
jgi:hypothetical protein